MAELVPVSVPVSGNCSACGSLITATIAACGLRGHSASGSADGKCPVDGCPGWAHMTGSVTVP